MANMIRDDLMRRMPNGGTLLDALWASWVGSELAKRRTVVEASLLDKLANDWIEFRKR